MTRTLSHTFKFQTPDTTNQTDFLENIIYITEEDEKKHFIQYMQYKVRNVDNKEFMESRQISVKVDRNYYLEIANINIDDKTRRRKFFSILGRRRFGANSKAIDYYLLNKNLNTKTLDDVYKKLYDSVEHEPCHTEYGVNSVNSYKIHSFDMGEYHILFLDQINVTNRKRLKKSYFVELNQSDFDIFNNIHVAKSKVEYVFNKIGKIHFKSLEVDRLEVGKELENIDHFSASKLNKKTHEMELEARVNENSVFRALREQKKEIEKIYFDLYSKSYELLSNPENEDTIHLFSVSIVKFGVRVKEIKILEEITAYFTTIQMLAESQTISYLLTKHDKDFRDIFLYMLEALSDWNNLLGAKNEDARAFNVATIDLQDALRYLVDVCFKFKHEYVCQDLTQKETNNETTREKIALQDNETLVTSAKQYFEEIELEDELYEELVELEHEIGELPYITEYNENLNQRLINFFNGYMRALNPLFEFKDLSYSLMLLSKKLQDYRFEENSELLLALLKGLVADLLEWKKSVLIEKTAEDIHYMNKSFYSNIAQIEMSIEKVENREDDAIEFF